MLFWALIAAIALRILIPRWRKKPPNELAAVAVKARGVGPTGPDGKWTRRDRLHAASFSGTAALVLAALAVGAGYIEQLGPNGSPREMIASGFMFLGAIGIVMAVIMAGVHVVGAMFTR